MASRSLGTLTLDLVANIGGYTAGLGSAEREAQKRAAAIEKAFDNTFSVITAGFAAMAAAGTAALAAVNAQAEAIANYQDLAEKIGDTASNITSLQQAATLSGTALDTVAAASVKLTAALSKTDDESKAVGQAIQALGLNFESFKALSPVEQIDAVARSLAGFADGAEKTAVAVALFGKSGAELLPFLNDLGEQTERQVTLTDEQIRATDDYVKAQARLKAEFDVFIQQQTAELIPTLSGVQQSLADIAKNEEVVAAVTTTVEVAVKAAIIAFQAIAVVITDVIFVVKQLAEAYGAAWAAQKALLSGDFSGIKTIFTAYNEQARAARAEVDKFQKQVMNIGKTPFVDDEVRRLQARSAAASAPAQRPRLNIAGLATGGGGGGGGSRRSGGGGSSISDAQRYLENLQKQLEKTQELSTQEQVLLDIQKGRLGTVTEAQKDQLLSLARQIDGNKELAEVEKQRAKVEQEAQRAREQFLKEGQQIYEQTRAPIETYIVQVQRARELLAGGAIDADTYARQIEKLGKAFEETENPLKETNDQMDEFSKNLAQGVQSTIADALTDGFKGGFKDIEKSFTDMLIKMAAQAVAADLTRKLFGAAGGGEGEGWLGAVFSMFSSGARANGGPVLPNSMYKVNERGPEVFQAANGDQFLMTGSKGGRVNPNAGGFNQSVNVTIVGAPDNRTPDQIAMEVRRQTNSASRRFG